MTRIIADISVSVDGFVTGPDPGPDNGLGTGGEALHTWAFSDDPEDRRILREATARPGAVVLGRRLFAMRVWLPSIAIGRAVGSSAAGSVVHRVDPRSRCSVLTIRPYSANACPRPAHRQQTGSDPTSYAAARIRYRPPGTVANAPAPADERAEGFDQGIGRRLQRLADRLRRGGRGEGLPDGVAHVTARRSCEPVEVKAEVPGTAGRPVR